MGYRELSFGGKVYMGRVLRGEDLLLSLTRVVEELNISAGKIEGIGALEHACVGYYNQQRRSYQWIEVDEPVEVVSFGGNISFKEKSPFIHAHVVLADSRGRCVGGHVGEGCRVFAFEYMIFPFEGHALNREMDIDSGLYLWNI